MLNGRIILITGASRGIGRQVALALAEQGAELILLARTTKDLASLHDEIVASDYKQPGIFPCNLCTADLDEYQKLHDVIAKEYGRLDGIIHIAGTLGMLSPIEHFDIKKWYQVMQVNLNSPFIITQMLIPLLKKSAAANIIFTVDKQPAKANWGAYAVSNRGLQAMSEILKDECRDFNNIAVSCVYPEKINTRLRASAYPAEDQANLLNPQIVANDYLKILA